MFGTVVFGWDGYRSTLIDFNNLYLTFESLVEKDWVNFHVISNFLQQNVNRKKMILTKLSAKENL